MSWHRVLLLAERLWVDKPEGPVLMGLYVTRFVQADDMEAAARLAAEALRQELQRGPFGSDQAMVRAEEVTLAEPADEPDVPLGYTLFTMDPAPPFLLMNPAKPAVWIELRAVQEWSATRSFVNDGHYSGAEAHDGLGRCWPVLDARFAEKPAARDRLRPWRLLPLAVRLGPSRQVPFGTLKDSLQQLWQEAARQDDRPPLPSEGLAAAERVGDLVDLILRLPED